MRTLAVTLIALIGALALAAVAQAKGGPLTVEISGGDLAEPVALEEPLGGDVIFANDGIPVSPPQDSEVAYDLTLTDQESGQTVSLTYFPGDGESESVLRGNYDDGPWYFLAGAEFESILDSAIASGSAENDDSSIAWYLIPTMGVGIVLAGGLAGRRFFRHRPN